MSDETTPAATGTPAAPAPSAVTPPAAATTASAASAASQPETLTLTTAQLNERLERSRATILKDLGVADIDKAKAAIAAAAKAEQDAKSIADRLADESKQRAKFENEAERHRKVVTEFAARQMIGLTAEQQEAVKAIAGDDAAAQLHAITALAPTWSKTSAAATTTEPAKAVTPPNGTAPQPSAPAPTNISPTDHKAVHAALAKTNPFAAAQYAIEHVREVFPDSQ